jgi:hypothetical protein
LRCITAQLEGDPPGTDPGDEPYVVIFTARIGGGPLITRTVRTHVFSNVDSLTSHLQIVQVWPLSGPATAAPIPVGGLAPIFLAALIEGDANNKEAHAEHIRSHVQTEVTARLVADLPSYLSGAINRATLVNKLRDKMQAVINLYKYHASSGDSAGDEDDHFVDDVRGGVQELTVSSGELSTLWIAGPGSSLPKVIGITDTDDGVTYELHFRLRRIW